MKLLISLLLLLGMKLAAGYYKYRGFEFNFHSVFHKNTKRLFTRQVTTRQTTTNVVRQRVKRAAGSLPGNYLRGQDYLDYYLTCKQDYHAYYFGQHLE